MSLTDLDPMPFGQKWKGWPMDEVPASYLHWYWSETDRPNSELNEYIENNLEALKQEYKDGIWDY
jgi:uncharacterized protein (DUF3820 family)